MMNDYSEKTAVRTRRTPFRPAPDSDADQSMNVLPIGTHLGEFEILDLIGEGGFGIVYLAYDHSLERHVALKEYMPSGLAARTTQMAVTVRSQRNADTFTAGLKSFINEAKMLAQFDSPSLVKVHRFWEGNGTAYMVMPFYEGTTLKQALKERRITPTESWIRVLLADLFDAIETIHSVHCLHRDIAPDNILLLKDGRPLLLDFGAARRVIGDLTQRLTVILKPGFAPIEQYANSAGLRQGEWTDIYALAAVVYYLISGKAPPAAVARMVHDEMMPATEAGKGRYSPAFLAALDKALAVKPEQRFRSIGEMRRALDIMDTVPRTLPRSGSHWSTTVAHTVPLADAAPEPMQPRPPQHMQQQMQQRAAQPTQKPMQQPMPHRMSDPMHPRTSMPRSHRPSEPVSHRPPEPSSEMHSRPRPDIDWRKPQEAEKPAMFGLKSGKPAWLALGLLLSTGIAAGVYWGTQRWDGAQEEPIASSSHEPLQSSGSSEATEQETDQAIATAPAASAAPSVTPSPSMEAPAKSEPLPEIASSTPRSQEAAIPKSGTLPSTPTAPPAPSESRLPSEVELWRMASASDKASAYEDYLREYPKGRYAALAKLRLDRMQPKTAMIAPPATLPAAPKESKPRAAPDVKEAPGAAAPASGASDARGAGASGTDAPRTASPSSARQPEPSATKPDDEAELWRAANAINEGPAYEAYLNLYPKGRYAALAKDRLASFAPAEPKETKPPPVAETVKTPETAPSEPVATEGTDKLASIKPSPEPTAPPASKPTTEAAPKPTPPAITKPSPEPAAKPAPPVASSKKTIKLDDQTMVGDFSADPKTGIVSGTGKITWTNGNQFEGTLVRGSKEGKGKFVWHNGQRYSGDWARDMPNGKGTIVFANGNRYEGDVKDGVPHGQGTNRFKAGDVYTGAWVMGKSHGRGRYTWANGSYWEGEFRNDQRTENGTLVFSENALKAAREKNAAPTVGASSNAERAAAGPEPAE